MSRRVRAFFPATQAVAGAPPIEIDTYFDKVVKYIRLTSWARGWPSPG
jgi:hypothetical protein